MRTVTLNRITESQKGRQRDRNENSQIKRKNSETERENTEIKREYKEIKKR